MLIDLLPSHHIWNVCLSVPSSSLLYKNAAKLQNNPHILCKSSEKSASFNSPGHNGVRHLCVLAVNAIYEIYTDVVNRPKRQYQTENRTNSVKLV